MANELQRSLDEKRYRKALKKMLHIYSSRGLTGVEAMNIASAALHPTPPSPVLQRLWLLIDERIRRTREIGAKSCGHKINAYEGVQRDIQALEEEHLDG